jgi:hypothetical protein
LRSACTAPSSIYVHGYVYPTFGRIKGAEPTGIAHVFVNGRPVWSDKR